jgi:uncharacterized protein
MSWLDAALSGSDTVGLTWVALLAFARLSTKVGLFPSPLTVEQAFSQIDDWLGAPGAQVLHPGPGHARVLRDLLDEVSTGGNLVNDAHLAAIAIEHRAGVVSYDADFGRFPGVRWDRPDALAPADHSARVRRGRTKKSVHQRIS